jgi:hypothetical protein
MEPADSIIAKFGGPNRVAGIVKVHRTRVSKWKSPRESGGTGGLVPQRYHRTLLDYAAEQSIPFSAEEFLAPRQGSDAEPLSSISNLPAQP